jgi:hypothetical protein
MKNPAMCVIHSGTSEGVTGLPCFGHALIHVAGDGEERFLLLMADLPHDEPRPTLTNTMGTVLGLLLRENVPDPGAVRVVYRDSDGRWDQFIPGDGFAPVAIPGDPDNGDPQRLAEDLYRTASTPPPFLQLGPDHPCHALAARLVGMADRTRARRQVPHEETISP